VIEILIIDDMRSLFKVNFSEKGSNYRPLEEAAYIFFIDFMEECAGNISACTLTKKLT